MLSVLGTRHGILMVVLLFSGIAFVGYLADVSLPRFPASTSTPRPRPTVRPNPTYTSRAPSPSPFVHITTPVAPALSSPPTTTVLSHGPNQFQSLANAVLATKPNAAIITQHFPGYRAEHELLVLQVVSGTYVKTFANDLNLVRCVCRRRGWSHVVYHPMAPSSKFDIYMWRTRVLLKVLRSSTPGTWVLAMDADSAPANFDFNMSAFLDPHYAIHLGLRERTGEPMAGAMLFLVGDTSIRFVERMIARYVHANNKDNGAMIEAILDVLNITCTLKGRREYAAVKCLWDAIHVPGCYGPIRLYPEFHFLYSGFSYNCASPPHAKPFIPTDAFIMGKLHACLPTYHDDTPICRPLSDHTPAVSVPHFLWGQNTTFYTHNKTVAVISAAIERHNEFWWGRPADWALPGCYPNCDKTLYSCKNQYT